MDYGYVFQFVLPYCCYYYCLGPIFKESWNMIGPRGQNLNKITIFENSNLVWKNLQVFEVNFCFHLICLYYQLHRLEGSLEIITSSYSQNYFLWKFNCGLSKYLDSPTLQSEGVWQSSKSWLHFCAKVVQNSLLLEFYV